MKTYSCFTDEFFFKTKVEKKFPIAVWRGIDNLRELNDTKTKTPQLACSISKNISALAKQLIIL